MEQQIQYQFPQVTKESTRAFSNAWDQKGIKIIIDDVHLQFATDWANICLKGYAELMAKQAYVQLMEAQAKNLAAPIAVSPDAPQTPATTQERKLILAE